MVLQEKIIGRSQILELVENAAQVAVQTYGLKIWGLDIVGGVGANTRPIVRIFVDTPWEGKTIPFIMPETRAQKSRKKAKHPKQAQYLENNEMPEARLTEFSTEGVNLDGNESMPTENLNDTNDINGERTTPLLESFAGPLESESVDINQCAHISRMISIALEVEDAFADAWVLEVSSPGLERQFYKISQLNAYIGHPLDVSLTDPHQDFENRRKFRGTLKAVQNDSFTLILDAPLNAEVSFAWDNVKKVHLIHIFPDTTLVK